MMMRPNKEGADWRIIRAWIDEQIAGSHERLEGYMSPDYHHYERGRIAVLRDLIELVEPKKLPPTPQDENYG